MSDLNLTDIVVRNWLTNEQAEASGANRIANSVATSVESKATLQSQHGRIDVQERLGELIAKELGKPADLQQTKLIDSWNRQIAAYATQAELEATNASKRSRW